MGANVSPCSSSTGEVPPVLACGALCPVPVLRGGPHGRVQHAAVHPPGVQSDGCQGKCNCWLPSSPASCPSAPPLSCPGQQREHAAAPEGTRKQGAALYCRQKGLLPLTCCCSHHKLSLASCVSPGEQLREPYQHQTLPCLRCALGQAFNLGSPVPGVSVCSI